MCMLSQTKEYKVVELLPHPVLFIGSLGSECTVPPGQLLIDGADYLGLVVPRPSVSMVNEAKQRMQFKDLVGSVFYVRKSFQLAGNGGRKIADLVCVVSLIHM